MRKDEMKAGFYPALGTPTNSDGTLVKESFNRQTELMIEAGAQGLLCMGSMGKMESIRNREYPKIAKECVNTVSNRIPILIGVMDCSINRILDRIDALDNIKINGVVVTVPFYYKPDPKGVINFFRNLSEKSKYPVYIYDLPSVTQFPITFQIMEEVEKMSNIVGIKTANISLILDLQRNEIFNKDFSFYCSNLDLFDVAINSGIYKNLDGMFTCTPYNSKKMYQSRNSRDISNYLNKILKLRNLFVKENVLAAYSYAMKLLNCPGKYNPDYAEQISDNLKEEILQLMKGIGEI